MMDRSSGREEVAALVAALALLGAASLLFTHVQSNAGVLTKTGRVTRTLFAVATWLSSLGAIFGWLLVLAELVLGPISPINPWLLAVAFGLVAPPVGQMSRRLAPAEGDVERQNKDGRA
jgi:hypothetical protein